MTGLITRSELALYQRIIRPVLFRWAGGDPEAIHEDMIRWLGCLPTTRSAHEHRPTTVAGIRFPNPVGVAAGLDKDGVAAAAWARLGFGFAELGTVTAQAQPGNPKPRMFRAKASRAVINRMGFNNAGAEALADRLLKLGVQRGNRRLGIPLGISIGKTKMVDLARAAGDYLASIEALAPYADYFAINISSPNTPGLRALQAARELDTLLSKIVAAAAAGPDPVPVFVKLAPDLEAHQLRETLATINASGVAGIIATNTTLGRDGLAFEDQRLAVEAGGLSGAPLTRKALSFVAQIAASTDLAVIGVGGIMSPRDAVRMLQAGASLVQLYTGFIYAGPALVRGIHEMLRNG
ncbi:MAG: quinone-dependent dihydroorotate dehydrogenase [Propionibacteriaceae bacterium]|nr:quinone-dependent dihydroorotate dehydrogenase [Propionibacteriaceae bacterium]